MSKEEKTVSSSAPGARLRAERERRGQAVGDIAAQLRLDGSVIQALEADDYDRLPAAIFVKGYIRSYGTLMSLDIDELWFDYRALAAPEEHLLVSNAPRKETDYRKFVWIILAVLIVAGLFGLAWLSSGKPSDPVDTNDVLPPVNGDAADVGSATDVDSADELLARIQSGNPRSQASPAQEDDSSSKYSTDTPNNLYSSTADQSADHGATTAPAGRAVEPVSEPAAIPIEPSDDDYAAKPEVDTPLVSVEVVVTDEAWVSIRDADENRLVRDLLDAGETVQARGVAPLIVNLGQAQAVILKVNGEVFDHSKYHRANKTARFEIKVD
jgi:cytoskeleton protein RodZ